MPVIVAAIAVWIITPLQEKLERRLKPGIAAIVCVMTLMAAVVLIAFIFISPVIKTVEQMKDLPAAVSRAIAALRQTGISIPFDIEAQAVRYAGGVDIGFAEAGSLLSITIAPLYFYFFIRDRKRIASGIMYLIPTKYRDGFKRWRSICSYDISRFMHGQLITGVITAIPAFLIYLLIGLENAFSLGVIMGISALVPFLGPIAGAVPALAAALPSSGLTIIMTVVAVIVIQQAVGGLIAPKMLGDSARVSPAWGVLAVMVGVSLFGLLGLIAAIPVLIAVKAAFKVIVKNNLAHNVHNV